MGTAFLPQQASAGIAAGAAQPPRPSQPDLPSSALRLRASPRRWTPSSRPATVARRVARSHRRGKFRHLPFARRRDRPTPGALDAVRMAPSSAAMPRRTVHRQGPGPRFDTALPFGLNSRQQTADYGRRRPPANA